MRVAIQQPYFIPYPGYFQLHKKIDTFVIFDDVQFNRRGFVHRNKIVIGQNLVWITLPLKKMKREVKLNQLEFDLKSQQYDKFMNLIKILQRKKKLDFLKNDLTNFSISPIEYIMNINQKILLKLGIKNEFLFSSKISNKHFKGEEKIIDICKKLNTKDYFNLSGGKKIYNEKNFLREKIRINFLEPFSGENISILDYFANDKVPFDLL
jgi:hypothetical protein